MESLGRAGSSPQHDQSICCHDVFGVHEEWIDVERLDAIGMVGREQRNAREARQTRLERDWFREAPTSFGRHFLPLLAEDTGGSVLVAERSDQLRDTFLRVIRDFKSRYILSYQPRGVEPGGWHAIDVSVKGRRAQVTARRGYLRGSP